MGNLYGPWVDVPVRTERRAHFWVPSERTPTADFLNAAGASAEPTAHSRQRPWVDLRENSDEALAPVVGCWCERTEGKAQPGFSRSQ